MKNLIHKGAVISSFLLLLIAGGCEKDTVVTDVPDAQTLNALRAAYDTAWSYNDSLAICLADTYWIHQDSLSWVDRVHFCDNCYHQWDAAFDGINLQCQQQIQAHTGNHHMGGNMGNNYSGYTECLGLHNALVQQHQLIHPHF